MANRAYLLTVDHRSVTLSQDPRREIFAEGINEVPVFWASLFTPADRQVDSYDGDEGSWEVANWCADSTDAKARLQALRVPVARLLDNRSAGLWEQWVEFLVDQECRFFKTNAGEVWALDPEGYEDYWAVLLRAFADPSAATMKAAVERNGLRCRDGSVSWDDDLETTCKLAGADHIRDLPWLAFLNGGGSSAAR